MSQDTRAQWRKSRSVSLYLPRRPDAIPIPPSLANSPYLLSPDSIFRKKIRHPKSPMQKDDEWLRDLVPLVWLSDTEEEKAHSDDGDNEWETLRPNSSRRSTNPEIPPSPILRPWSSPPTPFYIPVDRRSLKSGSTSSQIAV
ncbi:hypothetical protein BJ138DRAFT_1122164 [Hygrophoropsis aurantiaca]|uniref:Uncharacterized protein n=1 Tax=Hygrophoropsis aurantiaca TaxID=72124 RepID=A0ACB8ASU9_9AGAM|nr:hypothetical protein BJ138DRAFT_1122164 [Hygrophoropsis aurantiaca]